LALQRYVSRELTHFVGRSIPALNGHTDEDVQYSLLIKIIRSGWLTHPPHNPNVHGNLEVALGGKISDNQMYSPQVVCFCDIPSADLYIHIKKYSRFGLSFLKPFLVERGANPVFYIAKDSKVLKAPDMAEFTELIGNGRMVAFLQDLQERGAAALGSISRSVYYDKMLPAYHELMQRLQRDIGSGVMDLRHFLGFHVFSFMKFFDQSLPHEDPDNYYMEREWRLVGNLQFGMADVYRVILPEAFARKFRNDVPEYCGQLTYAEDSGHG
jgi:hypothetical protein